MGLRALRENVTKVVMLRKTKGKTKSAMLQMDNPETTDGVRHRPETASLKS
jgi:hypothetical protein